MTMADTFTHCLCCRFWKPLSCRQDGHVHDGGYTVTEDDTGLCRRRAPAQSRIPLPAGTDSGDAAMATLWPVTLDTDWCGEFEVKDTL
jgi:hypothetical protein